jgi:hypothetical protein
MQQHLFGSLYPQSGQAPEGCFAPVLIADPDEMKRTALRDPREIAERYVVCQVGAQVFVDSA